MKPTRRIKKGTATLEFVLGLPFLVAIGATILALGLGGVKRTGSIIEARKNAWDKRSDVQRTGALYLGSSPDAGLVKGESQFNLNIPGGKGTYKHDAAVLAGTWDHRQIDEFEKHPGTPHVLILTYLASDNKLLKDAVGAIMGVGAFIGGLAGSNLPGMEEVDRAREQADTQDEVDKANDNKKKELQKEIDKRRARIKQLEAQRKPHEDKRDRLNREIPVEEQKLQSLLDQAAAYGKRNPPEEVPASLTKKINDQRNKINQMKRDRQAAINEINRINREISRLEGEIRGLEGMK